MGAEIIRELVSIAAGLDLKLEFLCLCDIDIKTQAPECGSLYTRAVIFIVRVSQFNLLARAVFYYKHARLFDIVKYDALQNASTCRVSPNTLNELTTIGTLSAL